MWSSCNRLYTVLKSWAFSAINHWMLHRQCDKFWKFLLFVIICHIRNSHHRGILYHTKCPHSYMYYIPDNFVLDNKVLGYSQQILWFIKDTFALWSITNMSVIENELVIGSPLFQFYCENARVFSCQVVVASG